MRLYFFYFISAVTLLASAGAEAASLGAVLRANNEFVLRLMHAFGNILH